jgi:hypothetical protein
MGEFEDAYDSWRSMTFPHGATSDELGELQADLALADTWVAEAVIPYAEDRVYRPAKVDVMDTLGHLIARANAIAAVDPGEAHLASSIAQYAQALMRIYQAFLRLADRGDGDERR